MSIDPICGMEVDESTALRAMQDGRTYYFCCERCLSSFLARQRRRGNFGIWGNVWPSLRSFVASPKGRQATTLFALLMALLLSLNGLNVVNSYVGRDFISALERRDMGEFMRHAGRYVVVFGASSVVAVFYRFSEERLGLLWRDWQTRQLLERYLEDRIYHRLMAIGEPENPDQRIAEDVREFTTSTLSFVLMGMNATFTLVAFSGVLWEISPPLFGLAVAYATAGSFLTWLLGRNLIGLNYAQSDKEANLRSALIGLRENARQVAILGVEQPVKERLLRELGEVVANARRVIAVHRNVGLFTTFYNYLIPIMPLFVVAHLYMRGGVEFGVMTQSAMVFGQLMGAFSLIVTQFQSISSYAAVTARLRRLSEAMSATADSSGSAIVVCETGDRVAFEELTLRSAKGATLVRRLSFDIPRSTRVLILSGGEARAALFEAAAGLWPAGEGRILHPVAGHARFVTRQSFLPRQTLRNLLAAKCRDHDAGAGVLDVVMNSIPLTPVIAKAGGLEVEQEWNETLTAQERGWIALAQAVLVAAEFVLIEDLDLFPGSPERTLALELLTREGVTYVAFGTATGADLGLFDAVLRIASDGSWECQPADALRKWPPERP